MRPEDRFSCDPVVAAAIAQHGLDMEALPWEPEEMSTMECVRSEKDGMPSIILDSTSCGSIRWYSPAPGRTVTYDIDAAGACMRLEGTAVSESMLIWSRGRRLSDLVEIPGADAMEMTWSSVTSHATGTDTCIGVQPLGQGHAA